MRQITLPAGQRTRIFRRRFSSIPQQVSFAVTGAKVSGTVERVGSRWILGRTHQTQPLVTDNRVHKGYWDTFFEVFVTPDATVTAAVSRPRMSRAVLVGALMVTVAVVAVAIATLAR